MINSINIEQAQILEIQTIHFNLAACNTVQSLYETVLKNINVLLDANQSFFHGINKDLKPVSRSAFGFDQSDPGFLEILDKYYDEYYQRDPVYKYLIEHAGESNHILVSPQEFLSDEEYRNSNFYKEFINPYIKFIGSIDHVLCLLLYDAGHPVAVFFFFREKSKPAFTIREKQLLELIVSPLIVNVRRITMEEQVLERDYIINELRLVGHETNSVERMVSIQETYGLTKREVDVSLLIMDGMTNILIADKLGVSSRTVDNHLQAIYKKLNIHNRTALANLMHQ